MKAGQAPPAPRPVSGLAISKISPFNQGAVREAGRDRLASLIIVRGAASAPRRRLSSQSASRRNFPDRHGPDAHRGCLRSARRVSPQPSTQAFVLPAAGRRPVGTPSETWEPNPCREVAAALPAPGPEPVPARAMGAIMDELRKALTNHLHFHAKGATARIKKGGPESRLSV